MTYDFYTGSYAKPGEDAIVKFHMDTEHGTLEKTQAYTELLNPSYLAFNRSKTMLYAVQEETPIGKVHALRVMENGLVPVCAFPTQGADPCHASLDESGRLLFVDNYTSGSLAVYPVTADGTPQAMSDFIQHEGHGPNPIRQECAHVHYTKEQDGLAYVVDLGLDAVFLYAIDYATGKLHRTGAKIDCPAGYGPRHLEFNHSNPDIFYLICELGNAVLVYRREEGTFRPVQEVSTLPAGYTGQSGAAALKMQNELLFASNRGHDSITVYRVGADGLLTLTGNTKTGGRTPRDFTLFGDYLVAANQDSNLITVLKVDWQAGTLAQTGMQAQTVKPTCIRKY